ncbi:protein of unknown function [Candidatus Nitrosocosmicus franklandus]|uniref:Uncharacterized protein n=1 Tax=Candidatus Nitrosocosmicus franklandianus TaxID=1798806 RepID=A0A484IAK0_9ARCH|nr:protein of unknown function [Candidatus Nitrosocosmicus franklandus]
MKVSVELSSPWFAGSVKNKTISGRFNIYITISVNLSKFWYILASQ